MSYVRETLTSVLAACERGETHREEKDNKEFHGLIKRLLLISAFLCYIRPVHSFRSQKEALI